MKFKVGDNVYCFAANKLTSGKIIRIYENMDHCEIRCINGGNTLQPVKLIVHNNLVKVPKFVADWIEYCKKHCWGLSEALEDTYENSCMPEEVMDWFEDCRENQELFARAWLDGYEVEQEPLYYVRLPIVRLNTLGTAVEGDYKYLWADQATGENNIFQSLEYPATLIQSGWGTKFTEQEIKAIDERYWQFAIPVSDEEEIK